MRRADPQAACCEALLEAQCGLADRDVDAGKPAQQAAEDLRQLHPGQRGVEAMADAVAEAEVRVVGVGQVEAVGSVKGRESRLAVTNAGGTACRSPLMTGS